MDTVTIVLVKKESLDGRRPFTIFRISDNYMDVLSHHETMDEATEAARRYASQVRFAGLDARVFYRDRSAEGARKSRQM
jgi:hypothetical protein